MAIVVVSVVALFVCVAALVEQANRQRIRLRLERQWAWSISHQPVPLRDRDFEVYVGCLWVEAGPVRLRWPERVVNGPAMTAQQVAILGRAVAHLERLELIQADERLKDYASLGFIASGAWWESARIGSRISAARGDYSEAIERRRSPTQIDGLPLPGLLIYMSSNWGSDGEREDVAAWNDALQGRLRSRDVMVFDSDRTLTLGEVLLRKGRREEALAYLRQAASLDPNGRVPSPGGMARAWLRKLNAFP